MNRTCWALLKKQECTTNGHTSVGWPAKTYINQFCADTGCCQEDLPKVRIYRDRWQERVKGIRLITTFDDITKIIYIYSTEHYLGILNLFQLVTPYEKPTSSDSHHIWVFLLTVWKLLIDISIIIYWELL